MDLPEIILGIVLLAAFALPTNAVLRHTRRPAYLASLYLLAYAEIVLLAQVASVLHWLNATFFIIGELVLAVAAQLVWQKAGQPPLSGPFKIKPFSWPGFRADPALWILGIGVGLGMLANAFIILATPPNNFDSMTYHLSRVGYFIQHQSLSPWTTINIRQTSFPYHAEVGILWTVLLSGSDRLAGFVQWSALFASTVAAAGMARLLGAAPRKSIFAAAILGTFPLVFLESPSTQNDLVVASFAISGIYLFSLGMRQNRMRLLALSGAALGLAAGTKTTFIIALPGLALGLLLIAWPYLRRHFKQLGIWVACCLAGFLVFSSLVYIQNIRYYHNPISSSELVTPVVSGPATSRLRTGASNLLVYAYQAVDFSGLPEPAASTLTSLKARLFNRLAQSLNLSILNSQFDSVRILPVSLNQAASSEETSWFGPLALILFIAALTIILVQAIRRRQLALLAPAAILVVFWITVSFLLEWTPFRGRYFVLPVVCAAPLLAWAYPERRSLAWLRWLIVLPALGIMVVSLLENTSKPLTGPAAIWTKTPLEVQTHNLPSQAEVIQAVEQLVPKNAALVTQLGFDDWDYPLFGTQFQRRIIPLDPAIQSIDANLIQRLGAEYLLVSPIERSFLGLPAGMKLVRWFTNDWMLFQVANGPAAPLPAADYACLMGTTDRTGLFELWPSWEGEIGLTQIQSRAPWIIEETAQGALFWLGEGDAQGLGLRLWSNLPGDTPAVLTMDISPGPGRTDSSRVLSVRHDTRQQVTITSRVIQKRPFDRPGTFQVALTIHPGINEIVISIDGVATVIVQPNGDQRPLMARLDGISLGPP